MTKPNLSLILIVSVIIDACSVPKKLFIYNNQKTGELTLVIDPSKKEYKAALIPLTPLFIDINISEPIIMLKLFDHKNELIWELKAKDVKYGGGIVRYPNFNDKEYFQIFPADQKTPEKLVQNQIYQIELTTLEGFYSKTFIFQQAEVYIDKKK